MPRLRNCYPSDAFQEYHCTRRISFPEAFSRPPIWAWAPFQIYCTSYVPFGMSLCFAAQYSKNEEIQAESHLIFSASDAAISAAAHIHLKSSVMVKHMFSASSDASTLKSFLSRL